MTYFEEKHKTSRMKYRLASAGVVNDILLFAEELNTADADTRPEVLRFVLSELLPELEYLRNLQDDVDASGEIVANEKEAAEKEEKDGTESQCR